MARKAPTKALSPKARGRKVPPPLAAATPGRPLAIPPPEVIVVRSKRVACDGVGGALGHPRVWLEMGEADFVECSYCDRRFVLAAGTEGPEDELLAPGVYEGSHGH
ncbi:zinc-finger domain-containing protein [Phenylobacterium sp.]|uniref:zinc-finger domain-containing protein n=1 Tax=Phenylobacterium sp. TaxID=1871053 RepID=UPI003564FCB4